MSTTPRCSHIRMGKQPCHALALKGQPLCHQHSLTHLERREARRKSPGRQPPSPELLFRIASIDDFSVIQQALSVIISGIAQGTIGPRRANPLIRALALDSKNLGNRLRQAEAQPAAVHPELAREIKAII